MLNKKTIKTLNRVLKRGVFVYAFCFSLLVPAVFPATYILNSNATSLDAILECAKVAAYLFLTLLGLCLFIIWIEEFIKFGLNPELDSEC